MAQTQQDGDLGFIGTFKIPEPVADPETEQDRLEKLKVRIAKMLARGKDLSGTTVAEREQAMAMAADFARRAGLELYEIEREMGKDERFIKQQMQLGGHANWRVQLACALANALICRTITHTEHQYSKRANARSGNRVRFPRADYVTFVGMPSDIAIIEYLYTYITRELEKLASAAYKEDKIRAAMSFEPPASGKAFRDDFHRGAISALRSKLTAMFYKPIAPDTASVAEREEQEHMMALVPLKEADVKAAEERFFPKLGKGRDIYSKGRGIPGTWAAQSYQRDNAYMAGREAAGKIDLRKGINGRATAALPSGD